MKSNQINENFILRNIDKALKRNNTVSFISKIKILLFEEDER